MALEMTNLRVLSAEEQSHAPGPEASILKIKGTEIQQAITELLVQAVGEQALPLRDRQGHQRAGQPTRHQLPEHAQALHLWWFK